MSLIILEGPRVRALLVGEAYECADALRDALESGWFASAQPDGTVERMELAHWLSVCAPGDGAARYRLAQVYDEQMRLRADFSA